MPANPMGQGVPLAMIQPAKAGSATPDAQAGAAFLQLLDGLPPVNPTVAAPVQPTVPAIAGVDLPIPPVVPLPPGVVMPALPEEPTEPLELLPEEPAQPEEPEEPLDPMLAGVAVAPSLLDPLAPAVASPGQGAPTGELVAPPARTDGRPLHATPEPTTPELRATLPDQAGAEPTAAPQLEAELVERLTRREPAPSARPASTEAAPAPSARAGDVAEAPRAEPTSRLAEASLRAAELTDPEPLPGSVRLDGVRAARVTVPLDDGSVVRARLDVSDDVVDVALRASSETGLSAEQRVGELRQALAEHGLRLGEFEVTADAQQEDGSSGSSTGDPAGRDSEEHARAGTTGNRSEAMTASGDTNAPYARPDEEGRGGLLNRRF